MFNLNTVQKAELIVLLLIVLFGLYIMYELKIFKKE